MVFVGEKIRRRVGLSVFAIGATCAGNAFAAGGTEPTSVIIPALNLLLLIGLLVFLARKPLAQSTADKHENVKKAMVEAEELREQAEKMVADYRQKLEVLDQEIEKILEESRAHGETEKKRILERANRMAEKMKEDARKEAEMELKRMVRRIEKDVVAKASKEAMAILREKFSEKDHLLFADELLNQLETETKNAQY